MNTWAFCSYLIHMTRNRIYLSPPHLGDLERTFVNEAFDTNWISPVGPHIDSFERELAAHLGVAESVALSSGTAAIHLALILAGVRQGDEVVCQSFTFAGSCNPVVYLGASPVFIDSEQDTWNMDPALLETALRDRAKAGKKPKAIVVVDLYGMPARLEEIRSIADSYQVPLIEDAAEALGSTRNGYAAGTFGDFGVYSFNGNKIITTSGGGALISKQPGHIRKSRFLATQARDPQPHYEHSEIGYNYRLSNVCAAIGRGQLAVLSDRVERRRQIFNRYQKGLAGVPAISFQPEQPGNRSNRWLTTLLIDPGKCNGITREAVRLALERENIESRPLWKPMHLQPVFREAVHYSNGTSETFFKNGLCLPSGSSLSEADQNRILDIITSVLA